MMVPMMLDDAHDVSSRGSRTPARRSRSAPAAILAQPPRKVGPDLRDRCTRPAPRGVTSWPLTHCASLAVITATAGGYAPVGRRAPGVPCAQSGRQTVALVELYTSEGCDSCPPADRWLSSTFAPAARHDGAVALAFHVDYWDRLGWKDRFATAAWTKRQYDSARAARSDLVYTPQVLIQGRDFRDWHTEHAQRRRDRAAARAPARAEIALEVAPRAGRNRRQARRAHVPTAAPIAKGRGLFVALTEDGLAVRREGGREHGQAPRARPRRARRFAATSPSATRGDAAGTVVLPLPAEAGRAPTIVAFVQNVETGDVLQALALPLAPACVPAR